MGFDYTTIEGALTPEQAAAALAAGEGDTSAKLENGGTPDAATVTYEATATDGDNKAKPDAAATGKEAGTTTEAEDPANTVVMARDGKHTIPYETLVKHREGEQHWKAQAEAAAAREAAAQQQLADLQAQAQARADAGTAPTKTDNMVATAEAAIEAGADVGIFGDFSEEALAKGIATLVEQQVQARVNAALEPLSLPAAERDAGRAKSAEAVLAPPAALQTAPDRQEPAAPRSAAPAQRLQKAAPAVGPATDQERSSPAQWRADIAELRRQGRHAEAEARLAEFRRRYPAEPLEGDLAEPPR